MTGVVCVVGSFMMDLAVRTDRRPAPGETVVGTRFDMFLGGKGFNQAIAAARAGARVSMIGRLGCDEFGRQFLDCLSANSVDTTYVAVDELAGTGIGAPLIESSGENSIVVIPRANHLITVDDVERAAPAIRAADVLLLQLELPFETAVAAARIAKRAHTRVVLNPAPAPTEALIDALRGLVDVLVPNEVEARTICGETAIPPLDAATALSSRLHVPVVTTAGGAGCVVVSPDGQFELAAHSVPVVDTVGAGDAFCGALGAWLSAGAEFQQAVVYANAAGALAVTRPGAEPAMPTRQAIVQLAGGGRPIGLAADCLDRYVTP